MENDLDAAKAGDEVMEFRHGAHIGTFRISRVTAKQIVLNDRTLRINKRTGKRIGGNGLDASTFRLATPELKKEVIAIETRRHKKDLLQRSVMSLDMTIEAKPIPIGMYDGVIHDVKALTDKIRALQESVS